MSWRERLDLYRDNWVPMVVTSDEKLDQIMECCEHVRRLAVGMPERKHT